MAAFNSVAGMPAGTSPNDAMAMNLAPGQPQNLGMDVFDQELTFDESMLDGATLQNLPFTPSYDLDAFSTFEDPFSFSTRPFDAAATQDILQEESSPQELDNKLLGFSAPVMHATCLDEMGQIAETHMTAELYGMFFVAEDVFGGETTGRPLELTCYRRNLWQCSGQIALPRMVSAIVDEQGQQIQIAELLATITGIESIDGKATEIISIPWKNATQASEESRVVGAPPNITLDLNSGQELETNRINLPVSWKRLQFKHATANNGRRKGLQQHYVVKICLMGKSLSGELVKISEIQSGPVIVRGRSPRNFDSKKDVQLTGDKKPERKSTAPPENTTVKTESHKKTLSNAGSVQPAEWAQAVPAPATYHNPQQTPADHPAKRMALSPNIPKPPIPSWSADSNHAAKMVSLPHKKPSFSHQSTSIPISLSLSEDEKSPNRSGSDLQSPQPGRPAPRAGQHTEHSPEEDPDPLYEYFPLSVDDWMPPVDAVYRPHVVHHTIVPPEVKAQQMRSKSKRYFAPE